MARDSGDLSGSLYVNKYEIYEELTQSYNWDWAVDQHYPHLQVYYPVQWFPCLSTSSHH